MASKILATQPWNQWPSYVFHKGLRIEANKYRRKSKKATVKQATQAVLRVTLKTAWPAGNC